MSSGPWWASIRGSTPSQTTVISHPRSQGGPIARQRPTVPTWPSNSSPRMSPAVPTTQCTRSPGWKGGAGLGIGATGGRPIVGVAPSPDLAAADEDKPPGHEPPEGLADVLPNPPPRGELLPEA